LPKTFFSFKIILGFCSFLSSTPQPNPGESRMPDGSGNEIFAHLGPTSFFGGSAIRGDGFISAVVIRSEVPDVQGVVVSVIKEITVPPNFLKYGFCGTLRNLRRLQQEVLVGRDSAMVAVWVVLAPRGNHVGYICGVGAPLDVVVIERRPPLRRFVPVVEAARDSGRMFFSTLDVFTHIMVVSHDGLARCEWAGVHDAVDHGAAPVVGASRLAALLNPGVSGILVDLSGLVAPPSVAEAK
jgi:hypothetical protein